MDRRDFLVRTGLTFAAGALASAPAWLDAEDADAETTASLRTWSGVRAQFRLRRDLVHLGTFLLASHPRVVREAIARHRAGLDRNTVEYLHRRGPALEAAVLRAAASYLGARPEDIALTDSTTMGLGLLYNGLDVRPGQELLTTEHDFFATHAALAYKADRTGAVVRRVRLYEPGAPVSPEQIVDRLMGGVTPRTRVVAITWVHSSTGMKLPVGRIAAALADANAGRAPRDRALLCVDGVHGLGVENVGVGALGCDFLVAGTHKWLHGPRGTGLVWGKPDAWAHAAPTIPSFSGGDAPGARMTPGGFHSFEHRWALAQAFRFHQRIGKQRIESRIERFSTRIKDRLIGTPGIRIITPLRPELSAGLVCFEVAGRSPAGAVAALRERGIVATQTPYNPSYVRLGPGIYNTPGEIERAMSAVSRL